MIDTIVFDRLWETMRAKGVSSYTLREHCGIGSRTLRRLKANQAVTTGTLDKLCCILECELCDIAQYTAAETAKRP